MGSWRHDCAGLAKRMHLSVPGVARRVLVQEIEQNPWITAAAAFGLEHRRILSAIGYGGL